MSAEVCNSILFHPLSWQAYFALHELEAIAWQLVEPCSNKEDHGEGSHEGKDTAGGASLQDHKNALQLRTADLGRLLPKLKGLQQAARELMIGEQ